MYREPAEERLPAGFSFCTICGIIYQIESAEPLNNAYHGGSFKSQLRAQRRIKKAVARFGAEQSPARLLAVRTMWETQKSPDAPNGTPGDFLLFLQFLKPAGKFFFPAFVLFEVWGIDQCFGLFAGRSGFFDRVIASEMILLALEIDICTPSTVAVFTHTICARSGIFIDMASDRPCANRHKGRATRVSCAVNCPGFLSNVPVAICAMLDSRKPCDLYGGFLPTFRANSTAQKAA